MKKIALGLLLGVVLTGGGLSFALLFLGARQPTKSSLVDVETVGYRLQDGNMFILCMKRYPDYLSTEAFGWVAVMSPKGKLLVSIELPQPLLNSRVLRVEASDLRDRGYIYSPNVKEWIDYSVSHGMFNLQTGNLNRADDPTSVVQYYSRKSKGGLPRHGHTAKIENSPSPGGSGVSPEE